eukprot:1037812-Pyramimonas_sp.AAC.1
MFRVVMLDWVLRYGNIPREVLQMNVPPFIMDNRDAIGVLARNRWASPDKSVMKQWQVHCPGKEYSRRAYLPSSLDEAKVLVSQPDGVITVRARFLGGRTIWAEKNSM